MRATTIEQRPINRWLTHDHRCEEASLSSIGRVWHTDISRVERCRRMLMTCLERHEMDQATCSLCALGMVSDCLEHCVSQQGNVARRSEENIFRPCCYCACQSRRRREPWPSNYTGVRCFVFLRLPHTHARRDDDGQANTISGFLSRALFFVVC